MSKLVLASLFVVRILAAVIAAWQVLGLLPVLAWLSAPSQITAGMWFILALKFTILVVCLVSFFGLKRVASKLRGRAVMRNASA